MFPKEISKAEYQKQQEKLAWEQYDEEMKSHKIYMEDRKPKRESFESDEDFDRAIRMWDFEGRVTAPNPPGYVTANND